MKEMLKFGQAVRFKRFSLITGESFLSYFFEKYPIEYLELLKLLKKKIKIMSPDTVKMSALLLEKMKKKSGKDIQKATKQTGLADTVEFKMDKCFISSETFKSLFTDAGKNIVDFVENSTIAKYPDINHVVLVGEFAQSRILQDIIRSAFTSKRIHIPQDANMAAVKGALLMGQTDVTMIRSQDFQRERTQILSDTNTLGEHQGSPPKSPAKPTQVNRSEKRNQSCLCIIQ